MKLISFKFRIILKAKLIMKDKLKQSESGQVAIEYILLLVVMVTIFTNLAKKISAHYLSDDGTCSNPDSSAIVCKFKTRLQSNFRYYQF
ncbi:MAG: hypothetical protein HOJ35_00280 [Bdellovibrionales bacterium]|nr:hypothetical protein [Bdellovibrionales bacterium]